MKKCKCESTKYLTSLTNTVIEFLTELDRLMQRPSTIKRGRLIAQISNMLDFHNDQARYFGLGIDYRTDQKRPTHTRSAHEPA